LSRPGRPSGGHRRSLDRGRVGSRRRCECSRSLWRFAQRQICTERAKCPPARPAVSRQHCGIFSWQAGQKLPSPQSRHNRHPREGRGAFQSGRIGFSGFLAWLIHRAYHVYAIPTWERKMCVLADWCLRFLFGRDILSVEDAHHPRAAFARGGVPEHHATFLCDESSTKDLVDTA